tara:strand:- start:113 stop:1621 length:1509 start_codon:yes stop_codon:yes gene_type:complete
MAKSNYPNKLDTSVEIPVVRDNITEIGSDFLNSLRTAIFQIEKTLGINPQGSAGNTVSSRISKVLDDEGNLKGEALTRANVISGPISNNNISKTASIDESKLNLRYPTNVLQDQLSVLSTKINDYINSLEAVSARISAHIHKDAVNRHMAKAIRVIADDGTTSSSATMSISDGDLQSTLQNFYDAHINFSPGVDVSLLNRAHAADQVYYDNSKNSAIVTRTSVQAAIDDLVNIESVGMKNSNLAFSANGLIRTSILTDSFEGLASGPKLTSVSDAAYGALNGGATTTISFLSPVDTLGSVKRFDILTMSGSTNEEDNKDYIISSVTYSESKIASVIVYGGPVYTYNVGIQALIKKSIYNVTNENGLNATIRPRHSQSNTPDVQLAIPNAATVISVGIQPQNISETVRNLDIKIDDGDTATIDLYDSNLPKTLDSIVYLINKAAVSNRLNIMAYKIRSLNCFELAITHNLPNSTNDVKNRSIEIKGSSSNDALSILHIYIDRI